MEASQDSHSHHPNFSLQSAYQQINFYQDKGKKRGPTITCSNGPADFAGLFTGNKCQLKKVEMKPKSKSKNKKKFNTQQANERNEQIYMSAQPFYVGEVDHNIEEIGLMAVKEVRYVDEDQWQKMIKENQQYIKAIKKQKIEQITQTKKQYTLNRTRNQKGQFISKASNKKTKRVKKAKK